jgi:hypothetical protein
VAGVHRGWHAGPRLTSSGRSEVRRPSYEELERFKFGGSKQKGERQRTGEETSMI